MVELEASAHETKPEVGHSASSSSSSWKPPQRGAEKAACLRVCKREHAVNRREEALGQREDTYKMTRSVCLLAGSCGFPACSSLHRRVLLCLCLVGLGPRMLLWRNYVPMCGYPEFVC